MTTGEPHDSQLTIIRPRGALKRLTVGELFKQRELLRALVVRELRLRYKQTALGVLWVIIQPLFAAAILAFVFGLIARVRSEGVPLFLVALTGYAAWTAFGGVITRAAPSLISNNVLVTKIFFPRMLIPTSSVIAALMDTFVTFAFLFAILAYRGELTTGFLVALLPIAGLALFGWAVSLLASALMVDYRDVQHILTVVLQFAFYASPIAYPSSLVPEAWRTIYFLNPVAVYVEMIRSPILGTTGVSSRAIAYALATTVLTVLLSLFVFRSKEGKMADAL